MAKILVVEDEIALADMIADMLGFAHHVVDVAYDGEDGLHRVSLVPYELLILDWGLPNSTGIEICREYRSRGGKAPILILTGRKSLADKELGLDSGADDYLTKPFEMRELSARVRALMRRVAREGNIDDLLRVRDLTLSPALHRVMKGDEELFLTPKEFSVLEFLMRHQGLVYSGDDLINAVWSTDSEATAEALKSCVKRLRKKLGDGELRPLIETVHGVGYRLNR